MRQSVAAVLAVPTLVSVYLVTFLRRPLGRVAIAISVGALAVGLWVASSAAPPRTTADQPTVPTPLPVAAFSDIHVRQGLKAPVVLSFSTPMDEASVRAAVRVDPAIPVEASFDATGTSVTIVPAARWAPDTYYAVTVGIDARDRSGHPLAVPVRTAFLTRPSAVARLMVTGEEGGAVPLDSRFLATIEGDVDPASLAEAIHVTPAVAGSVAVTGDDETSAPGANRVWRVAFTPASPLPAGATFTVSLGSLLDSDGAPLLEPAALVVKTAVAPAVVRFRPAAGATSVPQAATISVRFSQPMDRPTTQAAFSATIAGKAVAGSFDWAEKGTVLLFKPASAFDYSQTVKLSVAGTALSTRGVPLVAPSSASFTTVAKPAPKPAPKAVPKPAPKPAPRPAPKPIPISGGSAASGTWAAVEAYYLKLLNCTRTGGWVTTSGSCLPGSNGTPALVMNAGLQTRVARPYAKVLATTGACSHTAGGTTFAGRLAAGGFSGYIWAGENVGCGDGDPYKAMLADHLFFQNEKSTNGGHYRNIMDPRFKWVGVGVWVYAGRCRLVTDFYDP